MSTSPKVSVCVPVYNGGATIAETLRSVLAQSFTNFELVVVDSASSDATAAVVDTVRDSRIRFIHHDTNLGMGDNWNRALRDCRGEYIKVLSADDIIYPDCLALQTAVLDDPQHRNTVLVGGRRDIIDDDGNILMSDRGLAGPDATYPGKTVIRKMVRGGRNYIGEPLTGLYRRSAFEQTSGYDLNPTYCTDMSIWFKLLLLGDFHLIGKPIGAFRVGAGSTSLGIARSQWRQGINFFRAQQKLISDVLTPGDVRVGYFGWTRDAVLRQVFYLYLKLRRPRPASPANRQAT